MDCTPKLRVKNQLHPKGKFFKDWNKSSWHIKGVNTVSRWIWHSLLDSWRSLLNSERNNTVFSVFLCDCTKFRILGYTFLGAFCTKKELIHPFLYESAIKVTWTNVMQLVLWDFSHALVTGDITDLKANWIRGTGGPSPLLWTKWFCLFI